jgi:hypothetical protein
MLIVNQDRDESFVVTSKDIYIRPHFVFSHFRLMFFGWNLYARTDKGRQLLSTFDTRMACRVTKEEIKQHERAGILTYTIPEEADDIEDLIFETEGLDREMAE